jgi:DNA-binding transcriptional regulator/RsmH inhibitor MraZ
VSEYEGKVSATMDGKGRITLPASFRTSAEIKNNRSRKIEDLRSLSAELADKSAKSVSLYLHVRDGQPCVVAFDMLHKQATIERMKAAAGEDNQARADVSLFAADLVEMPFDGIGRCSLPAECRAHLGIDAAQPATVLYVGRTDFFEVWTESAFAAHKAAAQARKSIRIGDYV